ncbi:MAG: hypothetical protein SGBAC_010843 [Bacillariaceae sp.]
MADIDSPQRSQVLQDTNKEKPRTQVQATVKNAHVDTDNQVKRSQSSQVKKTDIDSPQRSQLQPAQKVENPHPQVQTTVKKAHVETDNQVKRSQSSQVKKTDIDSPQRSQVLQDTNKEKPRTQVQATVKKVQEAVSDTQLHLTETPQEKAKDLDEIQLEQANKLEGKKEAPGCKELCFKKIDADVDEEAPRSKSLDTESMDKDFGYVGEKLTPWKKYKKKFCCSVLLVLLATLIFLIISLVQFRETYASSERGIGANGGGFGSNGRNTDAPSPSSPSTPEPTVVPPVKIYLENEFGVVVESEEAKKAVAQLVEEAMSNGGDGEVPLTPKTIQRFALLNMEFALAGGVNAFSRQSESSWGLFGQDECEWNGVTCNDNLEVTDILLGRQGLTGTIPTEIGLLQALTQLDLSKNGLQGSLPEELYDVVSLQKLFLYKNRLTGTISDKIIQPWNLTDFVINNNRLTGSIPSTMKAGSAGIFRIRYFNVYNNQMTGTIPSNLKLTHLYYMDLGRNKFSGTLPTELGTDYVRLRHLYLDHNDFSGTVPNEVINAGDGRLHSLRLNDNKFTGALPGNHVFDTELNIYEVQNNEFTSMDKNTCNLWVFDGGELVDFQSDCAICDCGNKSTMCQQCSK